MTDEAHIADLQSFQASFQPNSNDLAPLYTVYDDEEEDGPGDENDIQHVTKANNILPIWGDKITMNMNGLPLTNVRQSPYFIEELSAMKLISQVHDEIFYHVKHLEPWERGTRQIVGLTGMCGGVRGVGSGGVISTAFCTLYRLFVMRITRRQLVQMINSRRSPYIRGIGFMFIRFCQPPEDLWRWYEPYLDDEDIIDPKSGGGDVMTFAQMVRQMLTKLDWYGTLWPRIPIPIQKQIQENLKNYDAMRVKAFKRIHRSDQAADEEQNEIQEMREREERRKEDREDRQNERRERERVDRIRQERKREMERSPIRSKHQVHPPPKFVAPRRCSHHKRHHHCAKHRRKICPLKAKQQRNKQNETKH